jgi:hypothetical protein
LSEVAPGSDKITAGAASFVRSNSRFGQKHSRSRKFCLKSPKVRTKSQQEPPVLSEVAPGSDKIREKAASIV